MQTPTAVPRGRTKSSIRRYQIRLLDPAELYEDKLFRQVIFLYRMALEMMHQITCFYYCDVYEFLARNIKHRSLKSTRVSLSVKMRKKIGTVDII